MAEFSVRVFDRNSFPALYRSADNASTSGQKWYLTWLAANLITLVLAALAGSFSFSAEHDKQIANIVAAALFFASMGITILLAAKRWDRIWYTGRAVAESAKSITWKFITGAQPFDTELEEKDAVNLFTSALLELIEENKHLASALSGPTGDSDEVTPYILGLRYSETGVKRDAYLVQRVHDQWQWYATESEKNRKRRAIWFSLLVAFQGTAGLAAIGLAIFPLFVWKAAALFGALSSVTVAWGQTKRYQELSQAYGLAARELALIEARGKYVRTPDELARFVNDAETAISREHSMWVARRETK